VKEGVGEALGVTEGVRVLLGVTEGVCVLLGVLEGVAEGDGVREGVKEGVAVGVADPGMYTKGTLHTTAGSAQVREPLKPAKVATAPAVVQVAWIPEEVVTV